MKVVKILTVILHKKPSTEPNNIDADIMSNIIEEDDKNSYEDLEEIANENALLSDLDADDVDDDDDDEEEEEEEEEEEVKEIEEEEEVEVEENKEIDAEEEQQDISDTIQNATRASKDV